MGRWRGNRSKVVSTIAEELPSRKIPLLTKALPIAAGASAPDTAVAAHGAVQDLATSSDATGSDTVIDHTGDLRAMSSAVDACFVLLRTRSERSAHAVVADGTLAGLVREVEELVNAKSGSCSFADASQSFVLNALQA